MAVLGIHTSDVRVVTHRLPSEVYDVGATAYFALARNTCSEIKDIVRASNANRKTNALEKQQLAAVVSAAATPSADPHAITVGGGFEGNSGGRRFDGAGQEQLQQQQR